MALNFIKKVFSFGRNKEAAPEPGTQPGREAETAPVTPEAAAQDGIRPEPAPQPAPRPGARDEGADPDELSADPGVAPSPEEAASSEPRDEPPAQAFPRNEAMKFTPETAGSAPLSTPAPADEAHAGEPPIADEPVQDTSGPDRPDDTTPGDKAANSDEGLAPEELAADPAIEPVPNQEPEPRRLVVRDTVSRAEPAQPAPSAPEERGNWWNRLRQGLSRTSGQLTGQISGIFTKRRLDEDTLQDLEDVLLQADLGVETAMRITDALSASRYGKDISPAEVQKVMADEIAKVLGPVAKPLELDLSHKPHVILVVGVNGTGKTTTIGKLAAKLSAGGLKVTLAAGDTFRAAAIEQLKIWGERTGSKVVSTKLGADAAGLAYEAFETARADGADVLIIDTAGRLQNRTELMDELAKVVRVITKLDPDAPHTVLQTLDATTGQNALNQVEIFRNVAGVNGLVMTKLDGTARGGILVAIAAKHKLPVYFVGVGEGIDDLEPFEAADFASAIAGEPK